MSGRVQDLDSGPLPAPADASQSADVPAATAEKITVEATPSAATMNAMDIEEGTHSTFNLDEKITEGPDAAIAEVSEKPPPPPALPVDPPVLTTAAPTAADSATAPSPPPPIPPTKDDTTRDELPVSLLPPVNIVEKSETRHRPPDVTVVRQANTEALPVSTPTTPSRPTAAFDSRHQQQLPPPSSSAASAVPDTGSPDDEPAFDFQVFLDQIKSKSAEPVAKYYRSFLTNFSRRTFSVNDQVRIIREFLVFISDKMMECDIWKRCTPQEFENATEGMEKLVMNRLFDSTFTPQVSRSSRPVTSDDLEKDHVLKQRIVLFSWIQPEHLEVPNSEGCAGFLNYAQKELLKINHFKAPRDKLICILNSCKVIFGAADSSSFMPLLIVAIGLLRHVNKDESADAFVPVLIYIVLKANPDHLLSNIEYINRFRNPSKLQGEAGYYLSSLMGAVSFIETMDHTSISNITKEEFEQNVEAIIRELPTPPPTPNAQPIPPPREPASPYAGEESASPLHFPLAAPKFSPRPQTPDTSFGEDAKRFFQKTGETISRPMNLLGRMFAEALDGLDDTLFGGGGASASNTPNRTDTAPPRPTTPRRRPLGTGPPPNEGGQPYDSPISTPYQPRIPRTASGRRPVSYTGDYYTDSYPSPQSAPPSSNSAAADRMRTGARTPALFSPEEGPDGDGYPRSRATTPMDFTAMQREIDRAHGQAASAALETLLSIFPNIDREIAEMVLDANQHDLGQSIDKLLEMGIGT